MISHGSPPDDDDNDGGGYGRPPRKTRYAKGQSGYPAGRPPGRHREAPYEAVLGRMVTIREDGVERHVKADEAFLTSLGRLTCPDPASRGPVSISTPLSAQCAARGLSALPR